MIDRFPTTGLTLVARLGSAERDVRGAAFERIASLYWKPIYRYLRLAHRKSNEEAQDLTQSFLTFALEKEFLGDYEPARGRFRTFLRTCIDRFTINEFKAATREKRGGRSMHLDFSEVEHELPLATNETPEVVFERESIRALFENAIAELRARWSGKDALTIFERYDLAEGERPSYQQLAGELHMPVTTVTNRLAAIRRDFRAIALELLRETTATDAELRDEARRLFGSKAL